MSSVPCNSSIRFLYWSFSFIDVDTLLPLEVDRLLRFVQRSDQPCPLSRFKSTSVLRTKIGDSALALNRQLTHRHMRSRQVAEKSASGRQLVAEPTDCGFTPPQSRFYVQVRHHNKRDRCGMVGDMYAVPIFHP